MFIMTLVLSGCSAQASSGSFPEGGHAVDVPVLWVGTEEDGTEVGGVEETQVWTGKSDKSGFSVDLTGVEAEGAGDAWRAASASAATVATLLSGTDPASVDIQFHISSPIDGPSAGGILTVGILASLRGLTLKEHATMTGTISPDGSIGPIGGAYSKVTAAAKAGYTTVVIPESNRKTHTPTSPETIDLVAYGETLGVTVVPVFQLSQAFATLTGENLLNASAKPAAGTSEHTTNLDLQRTVNVTELLTTTSSLESTEPDDVSRTLIAEARSALDEGHLDLASGLSREAYLSQWRQVVESEVSSAFASGIDSAQALLHDRVTAALGRANDAITSTTAMKNLSDSQYASMPEMLLGVITAQATLQALDLTIENLSSEDDALRAGDILADQEAALDVFFPRDVALLMLVTGPMEIHSENPIAFLSNYTNFLVHSGEANMTYLASVLQTDESLNQHTIDSFQTTYPVLVALEDTTQLTTTSEHGLSQELSEAAYGLALYVNSGALITDAQALGLFNTGVGQTGDLSENLTATIASIESGLDTVTSTASIVDARGWDPAYALAQARAGAAFATNQLDESSSTNSVARGLNRLWAASIAVFLMQAAPE